jgi:hypothetical protein
VATGSSKFISDRAAATERAPSGRSQVASGTAEKLQIEIGFDEPGFDAIAIHGHRRIVAQHRCQAKGFHRRKH